MSDGTLRTFGILVALFQGNSESRSSVPLVAIEEPETALHPAAAGILLDSLRTASKATQVIITSHSPELLDDKDIVPADIRAVISDLGNTVIGPLDEVGRKTLERHLYTAGELLKLDQIHPDQAASQLPERQLELFAP
jgi:predicted ATPase